MKNYIKTNFNIKMILLGVSLLLLQWVFYLISSFIPGPEFLPSFSPKIPAIDDMIPVLPAFILPYLWAFVFWSFSPSVICRCGKEHLLDCLAAYLCSFLLANLIFLLFPTEMDRISEGLWNNRKTGILAFMMKATYFNDGSETGHNLFPSLHCMYSVVSFLGVFRREKISKEYRIYAFVTCILICLSTLFTKQHYVSDVISGVILGTAIYILCKKFRAGRLLNKPYRFISSKFNLQ